MHKSFKYLAMTALASALIAGQATTAFAFKMIQTMVLAPQRPTKCLYRHLAIPVTIPRHLEIMIPRLPLQKILPSLQAIPSLKLPRPQKTLLTPQQKTQLQQKLLRKTLLPRFRPIRHFYRYSFFVF